VAAVPPASSSVVSKTPAKCAIKTMVASDPPTEEVINLAPVKPLGDEAENIGNFY
jgi:hypothetical protein